MDAIGQPTVATSALADGTDGRRGKPWKGREKRVV
jgi:hypothetical protein